MWRGARVFTCLYLLHHFLSVIRSHFIPHNINNQKASFEGKSKTLISPFLKTQLPFNDEILLTTSSWLHWPRTNLVNRETSLTISYLPTSYWQLSMFVLLWVFGLHCLVLVLAFLCGWVCSFFGFVLVFLLSPPFPPVTILDLEKLGSIQVHSVISVHVKICLPAPREWNCCSMCSCTDS